MGYVALSDPLEELFGVGPAERAARRITERTGEELTQEVTRRSPVARPPGGAVATGEVGEWEASRKRTPGTLKESWRTSDVDRVRGDRWRVESYTEDPIAPHVEWDTSPHTIVPVRAAALRFWDDVGKRFAQLVQHPGTTGQHMMRDSLAELEADWLTIGEEEVLRWSREQARLVS
jgi:hypothetical protein